MLSLSQQIYESRRLLGHISYDFIDAIGEEVVAELDDYTDNQSGCGCDKGLRNTASYHRRLDVTSRLDCLKCVNHTTHVPEETDHRRQIGHCRQPNHTSFEKCHLYGPGVVDGFLHVVNAAMYPQKPA